MSTMRTNTEIKGNKPHHYRKALCCGRGLFCTCGELLSARVVAMMACGVN